MRRVIAGGKRGNGNHQVWQPDRGFGDWKNPSTTADTATIQSWRDAPRRAHVWARNFELETIRRSSRNRTSDCRIQKRLEHLCHEHRHVLRQCSYAVTQATYAQHAAMICRKLYCSRSRIESQMASTHGYMGARQSRLHRAKNVRARTQPTGVQRNAELRVLQ